jgi:AcrR family transcriptional regulator
MDARTQEQPRWERRKDARPAELLASALELFTERGYAATRLDDVARLAGVSKGTVYLYYQSKEDLFKAVVREGLLPVLERGEKMVAEHRGPVAELIRNLVHGWWQEIGSTPYGGIIKLMISECRNFPEIGSFYHDEVISRGHTLLRTAVTKGIESGELRGLDPEYVTRLLLAPLVLQVVWRYSFDFCGGGRLDAQTYIDHHLDVLLNGLLHQERQTHPAANATKKARS